MGDLAYVLVECRPGYRRGLRTYATYEEAEAATPLPDLAGGIRYEIEKVEVNVPDDTDPVGPTQETT